MVVPQNTPKWSFLVGKPNNCWGTHHFRKPPYTLTKTLGWEVTRTLYAPSAPPNSAELFRVWHGQIRDVFHHGSSQIWMMVFLPSLCIGKVWEFLFILAWSWGYCIGYGVSRYPQNELVAYQNQLCLDSRPCTASETWVLYSVLCDQFRPDILLQVSPNTLQWMRFAAMTSTTAQLPRRGLLGLARSVSVIRQIALGALIYLVWRHWTTFDNKSNPHIVEQHPDHHGLHCGNSRLCPTIPFQ